MAVTAALLFSGRPASADTSGLVRGTAATAGKPAPGITVSLKGEGTAATAVTDAGGRFSFPHVAFGHYTLAVHDARVGDASQEVDVQSNAVVDVTLNLIALREIGRTAATTARGVGSLPVSVNSVTRLQIAALPNNQSLNSVIETVPGIVHFSYNEPVAHGFHGLTYELDGVPLPVGTTSNFSEVIDPRSIDSLEVFTGAFPAEFGGSRQGAVVNIISHRANDAAAASEGRLTLGAGSYGSAQSSLAEALKLGNTRLFLNVNEERTNRGIDSPTFVPIHDSSNQSNQFLRTITKLSSRDTLAFDVSNNFAGFQIPINTAVSQNNPVVVPPGTLDIQREYDRLISLAYTHDTADGNGFFQLAPWYRYDRVAYDGDLNSDLQGTSNDGAGTLTPLNGLRQDRRSQFAGVRMSEFRSYGPHAVKIGVDAAVENFSGNTLIAFTDAMGNRQDFSDVAAKRGAQLAAYVQDKWTPTRYFSVAAGLRADRSTGYASGGQVSPRIEINGQVGTRDVLHAYFGRMYAAPFLEDTRRAAVVTAGGDPNALPVYDLKPERDSYYELGLAHTFSPAARAYVNVWKRNAVNVLDTTQIFPTPIYAVFNNAIGIAKGIEGRFDAHWSNGDALFLSASVSSARAGGVSGSTFLFNPGSVGDVTLNSEDHDQTVSATLGYTKRFGGGRAFFASLEPQYGTGYPVQFQNGNGRLMPHLTLDASIGRDAKPGSLGFVASFANFTNYAYLLKVNNGFNTTQYGPGAQFTFRVIAPL
ncbi:MAG: TonB-dependent receptor [Candidatus Eremiobacteraeota bacterium]|nr:TonB-dependent receptor [Candidatus Eremiobacteraeota bacterium]